MVELNPNMLVRDVERMKHGGSVLYDNITLLSYITQLFDSALWFSSDSVL